MNELIPVNILVGDRSYRLKIAISDEEKLRKTSKLINDKILEFKTNFAGKDMQDYTAMALLWFATEQNKTGEEKIILNEATQKIKALQAIIEKTLIK